MSYAQPLCGERSRYEIVCQAFGNLVEWYDFMLYVYLVSTFNKLFFPPGYEVLSFCLLWLIFGLSCLMRPVGSYIFGLIADKFSSIKAQKYSVLLMGFASIALALLPGYSSIGWLALILLLLLRCLQVGCASAQFTLSIYLLADKGRREPTGRTMVIPQLYSIIGIIIAGVVMLLNTSWFHMAAGYYWRLAYGLNVLFIVGYYIMMHYKKRSGLPAEIKPVARKNDFSLILAQWRPMLLLASSMLLGSSFVYVCVILYLPTYMSSVLHFGKSFDMRALLCCHAVIAVSLYAYSKIYDRIPNKIRYGLMLVSLLLLSLYSVLTGYSVANIVIILCVASLLYAPYSFFIMRAMILLFPEAIRNRCGGFAYNVGVSVSSFFPMVLSYLITNYHMPGFSYFFLFVSLAALPVFLLLMRRLECSLPPKLAFVGRARTV